MRAYFLVLMFVRHVLAFSASREQIDRFALERQIERKLNRLRGGKDTSKGTGDVPELTDDRLTFAGRMVDAGVLSPDAFEHQRQIACMEKRYVK